MQNLIITSDDCGLSEGINIATAELYEKGMVTAASVMTNFPATTHAFDLFSQYADLELGVHLNLTDGFPLTRPGPASSLTDKNGRFHRRPGLFLNAILGRADYLSWVKEELGAQIAVCVNAGTQPKHITTHVHFHTVPSLRRIVFELAEEFDIPRVRAFSFSASLAPHVSILRRFLTIIPSSPSDDFLISDYLVGVKWWLGRNPGNLVSALKYLDGVVEIIVHPCTAEDTTYPPDVIYKPHERYREVAYLEAIYELLWRLPETS